MIYLAGIFLFAIASAIPSGRVDVVFPSVETSRSGVKTVKFRALKEDIELKLEPAGEILAKNFVLLNEKNQIIQSIDVEDLKRRIYRDSAIGAALLIDEDGPVTIQGIVNSKLRIAPYESGRTVKDERIAHKIVEVTSDEKSFFNDAVISVDGNRIMKDVTRMDRKGKCIIVDNLVLTENAFTKRFKSLKALTEYVTVMYTGVQNLMDTLGLGIKVRLLGITAFTKESEPSYIVQSAIPGHQQYLHTDNLIDNMTAYYCKNATGLAKDADIIMLIVRRKLGILREDNTVEFDASGIAHVGTVCNKCGKVGISLDDSRYNERVDTVAHELAHLLGSLHDGAKGDDPNNPGRSTCPETDGYIMGDRSNKINKFKFSNCSSNKISNTLKSPQASCVFKDCKSY